MDILERLKTASERLRETAQTVDAGSEPPLHHLKTLAEIGYFDVTTEARPGLRRRMLDLISSGCGVTAFLATQHEGVCRRLHQAGHPMTKKARKGERWYGVCFAHLRRTPSPVEAIRSRRQVLYSGTGPWFSGLGVFSEVLVGGATEDGRFLMGLAAMASPEIAVQKLPELAVMNATATVGLHFNALCVPSEDVVVDITPEELNEKDMHSTVFQAARSLGAARAASRFMKDELREEMEQGLEGLHCQLDAWDESPNWADATALRQRALKLAGSAIETAFVQVGGKAHVLDHPLHRIAREASFYYTTQLTAPLRSAVTDDLRRGLEQISKVLTK